MTFLYKEMLEELEVMKLAGDIETFASEVLTTLEKEAVAPAVGAIARPVTKAIGKVVAPVHKSQMKLLKNTVGTPTGAAITGGAAFLVGPKETAKGLFPMIPSAEKAVKQVSSDLAEYNRVVVADDVSELIEKVAVGITDNSNLDVKQVINAAGASLLGGGIGYGLTTKAVDFVDNSAAGKNIDRGINKAVEDVGRGAARVFTRNRPGTAMLSNVLTTTGKFMDNVGGGGKKVRVDFSRLVDGPSAAHTSKTLGKYLALLAGASLAEEYLASWGKDKIDSAIVNYKMSNLAEKDKIASLIDDIVLEKTADEDDPPVKYKDLKRLLHERQVKPALTTGTFLFTLGGLSHLLGRNLYGGMERVETDEYRPANRVIIDIADPDAARKYYADRNINISQKDVKTADELSELIEKIAVSDAYLQKNKYINPMRAGLIGGSLIGTGILLNTASKLKAKQKDVIEEKSELDADAASLIEENNQAAIPADKHAYVISETIEKSADAFDTINMHRLDDEADEAADAVRVKDWKPETKLDKAKAKIDEKAAKGPKFIRRFDNFLANADKYKYKGRTGLGHWLLEEVPFKSVESLAYAAPMIATAVLLNRNAKRGFAPLQDDPNTPYVPDGMTRVIIQESGYTDKDGKVVYKKPKDYGKNITMKEASIKSIIEKVAEDEQTELDAIREIIDEFTLEEELKREEHNLRYPTKKDGVVNGVKKKQRMLS